MGLGFGAMWGGKRTPGMCTRIRDMLWTYVIRLHMSKQNRAGTDWNAAGNAGCKILRRLLSKNASLKDLELEDNGITGETLSL